jgi:hypothetical protein
MLLVTYLFLSFSVVPYAPVAGRGEARAVFTSGKRPEGPLRATLARYGLAGG